jgi:hypothetical protein
MKIPLGASHFCKNSRRKGKEAIASCYEESGDRNVGKAFPFGTSRSRRVG